MLAGVGLAGAYGFYSLCAIISIFFVAKCCIKLSLPKREDIEGSRAHAYMLGERGIITKEDVAKIIAIISEQGRTGNPGDGLIYVSDVEKVYRVKTGLENGDT